MGAQQNPGQSVSHPWRVSEVERRDGVSAVATARLEAAERELDRITLAAAHVAYDERTPESWKRDQLRDALLGGDQ